MLEYCVPVCSPYTAEWINRLEAIQRKFTRYAIRKLRWNDASSLPPYYERCRLLGLESLELRRHKAQIIFIAGLLLGTIDDPYLLGELSFITPRPSARRLQTLHVTRSHTHYGYNAPLKAMIRRFNEHSAQFDFCISITSFKKLLRVSPTNPV